mmetsp:Transcript_12224/g.16589  ORF Transcript_12224/g.16589 Transcript_12224/m.16589 type:complete len:201 (-) Transcript_12224:152-754(-)
MFKLEFGEGHALTRHFEKRPRQHRRPLFKIDYMLYLSGWPAGIIDGTESFFEFTLRHRAGLWVLRCGSKESENGACTLTAGFLLLNAGLLCYLSRKRCLSPLESQYFISINRTHLLTFPPNHCLFGFGNLYRSWRHDSRLTSFSRQCFSRGGIFHWKVHLLILLRVVTETLTGAHGTHLNKPFGRELARRFRDALTHAEL